MFSLGRDHFGCGIFAGKKSCYYIPLSLGNFDDMTKLCKKFNMQMIALETWEEYKFISNIIKRGKNLGFYQGKNILMSLYL